MKAIQTYEDFKPQVICSTAISNGSRITDTGAWSEGSREIVFHDRTDAALRLIDELKKIDLNGDVVLAIPRGGVPIGAIIAKELHIPLDLIVAKKIGHPQNSEFAIGSITVSKVVLDQDALQLPKSTVEAEIKRLRAQLRDRYTHLTGRKEPLPVTRKNVILIDDGLATGNTMLVCVEDLKSQSVRSITVAVPVSSPLAARRIRAEVDQFICLSIPEHFSAVGEFYRNFSEIDDSLVRTLLAHCMDSDRRK